MVSSHALSLVINASPLIALGKAGLLGLLEADAFRTKIPHAVAKEVLAEKHGEDATARWLGEKGASKIIPAAPPLPDPILLAWNLGAGETSVIAEAGREPASIAVLDDRAARRCAEALGQRCTGTLGFLLMAKRRGLLSEVAPAIQAIQSAGLYLAPDLVKTVLHIAGE
ncbi:putative nucleic acid-binding protein [Opitutaceae bacterium TAV1]|nr:putative nucleic acid-binding protein [Opitutaceae bacterium TAV1]